MKDGDNKTNQKPQSAEIHPGPGFRIATKIPRPNMNVAEMFSEFSSADISDQLNRLYGVESSIRRIAGPDRPLIGPACTVKVFPGDNLMVHKALDIAKPGDVVVVDAGGSIKNAVLGDIISTKATHRGIAGFVVDGYVRDALQIRSLGFPVYARGENMIGPLHRGPAKSTSRSVAAALSYRLATSSSRTPAASWWCRAPTSASCTRGFWR